MNVVSTSPSLGWWRLLGTGVLIACAAILVTGLFTAFGSDNPDELGWDFRVAYLPAAESVLEGVSPYVSPNDPGLDVTRIYAYPPHLAVALTPLAALPVDAAVVVAVLLSLAALMGALAVVGVRDVRCYAVVPIWLPAWNSLEMANVSALLALMLALVWRYRATLWPFAAVLGAMVSLKLFLWPMLVWAVATRRIQGAALAVVVGIGLTFASWAVIGFAGLRSYPDLLAKVATQDSYSIAGMTEALGFGSAVGHVTSYVIGGALIGVAVMLGRRSDPQRAFLAAIAASLALSPIVWLHYLVLLIVPLGLVRPRFSAIWLLPIVLWVCPRSANGDGLEPFLPALVVLILFALLMARPRPQGLVSAEVSA